MKFGVGQSVKRVEDVRLLTGKGRFTDDVQATGMAYAATLRSPYGHARIVGIATAVAKAVPGVLAVYTHADVAELGVIPCMVPLSGKLTTPHLMLASDRVRFVGDGVAFVVAETREAARLGAEAIEVILWLAMRGGLAPRVRRQHRHYHLGLLTGYGLQSLTDA